MSNHGGNQPSQSEDEEESLSLRDLPLRSTDSDEEEMSDHSEEASEEFNFDSLVNSLDALDLEMCAADSVFFRGQMLPFRQARSESMDRITGSGVQSSSTGSSSSESCSTRSSSINSTKSAGNLPQIISNEKRSVYKVRNQFHSCPSPKPNERAANTPRSTTTSANKKSALWEIFRLGIVRTPEIELEDLKIRYNKQHNPGVGTSGGRIVNNESSEGELRSVNKKKEWRKQRKRMNFMGCKCSVGAVEPEKAGKEKETTVDVNKRERVTEETKKEDETEKKETRQHRTTEWLKDHSHALLHNNVST